MEIFKGLTFLRLQKPPPQASILKLLLVIKY